MKRRTNKRSSGFVKPDWTPKAPPKVAIWMPFPEAIGNAGAVVNAYVDIVMTADRHKVGLPLKQDRCGQMDYGRTRACLEAIEKGFTHILMLDADHKHGPADLVERLLAHDKDVVGSLNFARGDGRPCAIIDTKCEPHWCNPLDDLDLSDPGPAGVGMLKCKAIGTGALMIRLGAIKDWPQPWFYMPYPETKNIGADQWPGEDGGFSINCQRRGVEIWCDTDLNSPHATTKWI